LDILFTILKLTCDWDIETNAYWMGHQTVTRFSQPPYSPQAFDPDLENAMESEIARHVSTRNQAFLTG